MFTPNVPKCTCRRERSWLMLIWGRHYEGCLVVRKWPGISVPLLAVLVSVTAAAQSTSQNGPVFSPEFDPPPAMTDIVTATEGLTDKTWPRPEGLSLSPKQTTQYLMTRGETPDWTGEGPRTPLGFQWRNPRYRAGDRPCWWYVAYSSMLRLMAAASRPPASTEYLRLGQMLESIGDKVCNDPDARRRMTKEWNQVVDAWSYMLRREMVAHAQKQTAQVMDAAMACIGVGGCPGAVPGHRPTPADALAVTYAFVAPLVAGVSEPVAVLRTALVAP